MQPLDLKNLQEILFSNVVRQGKCPGDLVRVFTDSRGVPVAPRLNAYRANVVESHLNALDNAFPVVRKVLGARYWRQLLRSEISVYGSHSQDLHSYGSFVPELLRNAQCRQSELSEYGYLGDLAELEWIVHRTQFVADEQSFDWNAFRLLSAQEQSRAVLSTSATLSIFQSEYPIDRVWHVHRTSPPPELPDSTDEIMCCVHRDASFNVQLTRLTKRQTNRLKMLQLGTSLTELEAAIEIDQEGIVLELFDWIERGYVVGFRMAQPCLTKTC